MPGIWTVPNMVAHKFPRYIPIEVIHPIVKEYCDTRRMGIGHGTGAYYSAVQVLAELSGVSQRIVENIYHNKGQIKEGRRVTTTPWRIVEQLLITMDLEYLWHHEPLSEYYVLESKAA